MFCPGGAVRSCTFIEPQTPVRICGRSSGALSTASCRRGQPATRRGTHVLCAAKRGKDSSRSRAPNSTDSWELKQAALDRVLADIERSFGKGSLIKLGEESSDRTVETTGSGALNFDIALGGGYPKGRLVEIYGPESSGKTTVAMHAMAEVQKKGGVAALIDAEHAFDPVYSRALGMDVDNLLVCQPESGEMALEVVDQLVRSNAVDIITVDSVAALVPRAEVEGEMGMVQVGGQARLMSQALRKLTSNTHKANCTVIFLNQLRYKVGVIYGSPEVTTGGNALKFYASVRIDLRRKEVVKGPDGEDKGIHVKAKIVKNKVAPPYRIAEFDIMFGEGICMEASVVDAATDAGFLTRKGSWFSYNGDNIGQGRDKAIAYLKDNPEICEELIQAVKDKYFQQRMDAADAAKTTVSSGKIDDRFLEGGISGVGDGAGTDVPLEEGVA